MSNSKDFGGLLFERVTNGCWLHGCQPGGFTDVTTLIHVNGPKVRLDSARQRTIVEVVEMPPPVRLPDKRIISVLKDERNPRGERVNKVIGFTEYDDNQQGVHDALDLACSTGVIKVVDADFVREHYPDTFASNQAEVIFDPRDTNKPPVPMIELVNQFQKAKLTVQSSRETAREAAGDLIKK